MLRWRVAPLTLAPFVFFYFLTTFLLTFGVNVLEFDSQMLLWSVAIAAGLEIITMPLAGAMADKYGRDRVFVTGAVGLLALAFPIVFLLVANPSNPLVLILVMIGAMTIVHPLTYALLSTMFTDLFPTQIRYTGVSLAFQFGGVVGWLHPADSDLFPAERVIRDADRRLHCPPSAADNCCGDSDRLRRRTPSTRGNSRRSLRSADQCVRRRLMRMATAKPTVHELTVRFQSSLFLVRHVTGNAPSHSVTIGAIRSRRSPP